MNLKATNAQRLSIKLEEQKHANSGLVWCTNTIIYVENRAISRIIWLQKSCTYKGHEEY